MRATVHERRALRVRGVVQGVGFRPFVYRLATSLRLAGSVRNDGEGVWIEVEGEAEQLALFDTRLRSEAPALSRIDSVEWNSTPPAGLIGFRIEPSGAAGARAALPADVTTCEACLRELRDPSDRRYRYPFTCCTDCGPRYTLASALPWDRARTSMAGFPLCEACRAEYEDPRSRRFHAEPNACPRCGPTLRFRRADAFSSSVHFEGEAALKAAIELLGGGGIVAIKGLGGYLLAVSPKNDDALRTLRTRKRRPHKPFALMVRDLEVARALCTVDATAAAALASRSHPILLLPAHRPSRLSTQVAPGLDELGLMLPCTPLHHLLLENTFDAVVMTSGNLSDEPIARTDEQAFTTLRGIADGFLFHDREIVARADDSVVRIVHSAPQPVRRARGFVPEAITLPFEAPPVLAVGPQLKSTVCLTRGAEALLSPHLGDLEHPETLAFFEESIEQLRRLSGVEPVAVAHDLHPDYVSTRWARASGLETIAVQHHHAHVASCLAEHGRTEPTIGVAFDGTGCGIDGSLWGGELLLADLQGFRRLAHLRPIALPGGEVALRQVWRLGLAAARDAGVAYRPPNVRAELVDQVDALLARPALRSEATGAGRWFDAVAALLGVRDDATYEGQAAIELEALAARVVSEEAGASRLRTLQAVRSEPHSTVEANARAARVANDAQCVSQVGAPRDVGSEEEATIDADVHAARVVDDATEPLPHAVEHGEDGADVLDLRPAIRALMQARANGVDSAVLAARFHRALADVVTRACVRAREETGVAVVALSGGCFQNRLLTELCADGLQRAGFEVLLHRKVPPNDGGLSLGQAAVVAWRLKERRAAKEAEDVSGNPR